MSIVWTNFLVAIVAFLGLYLLLRKFAFDKLFGIMEARRTMVQEQIQSAESGRKQAEQLLEEQKQALQQAKKEAFDIIEQARVTSTRTADDIVNNAKEEAVRLKEDAVRDIENEKNKAVAALRSQVSAMSVMIASKIIEKQVDEKAQQELVEQYLKDVGGAQ